MDCLGVERENLSANHHLRDVFYRRNRRTLCPDGEIPLIFTFASFIIIIMAILGTFAIDQVWTGIIENIL